jgi:hypothetical protein
LFLEVNAMSSVPQPGFSDINPRRDKLLAQEIDACEDPICCCEAEPRWLLFDQDDECGPCEWEGINRSPGEEL